MRLSRRAFWAAGRASATVGTGSGRSPRVSVSAVALPWGRPMARSRSRRSWVKVAQGFGQGQVGAGGAHVEAAALGIE
nr:hypothetical protein [Tanacetum cinerariifolium]